MVCFNYNIILIIDYFFSFSLIIFLIEIPPSDSYLFTFNAHQFRPLSVTRLKDVPRTGIVYLHTGDSAFRAVPKLPTVGYITGTTIVIIGDPEYINECKQKSVITQVSNNYIINIIILLIIILF